MRSSGTGRQRLRDFNTLDHVVDRLRTARKIIVVSGAGISVSTGIPDFRSRDGLYNTLDCAKIGIPSAELLFDMGFFEIDPAPFYRFAPALLPAQHIRPSPCHRFLALLQSRKQLLRNYTQNVDGLERRAGVTQAALMECHGSMATFKCTGKKCSKKCTLASVEDQIRAGQVCYCPCGEVLKPSVTFFGEQLPTALFTAMGKDLPRCDLLLVIGTSLKVGGSVHEVLRGLPPHVPQVLINRDPVALPPSLSEGFDVTLLGQCDDIASYLCDRLDWGSLDFVETATRAGAGVEAGVWISAASRDAVLGAEEVAKAEAAEPALNRTSKTSVLETSPLAPAPVIAEAAAEAAPVTRPATQTAASTTAAIVTPAAGAEAETAPVSAPVTLAPAQSPPVSHLALKQSLECSSPVEYPIASEPGVSEAEKAFSRRAVMHMMRSKISAGTSSRVETLTEAEVGTAALRNATPVQQSQCISPSTHQCLEVHGRTKEEVGSILQYVEQQLFRTARSLREYCRRDDIVARMLSTAAAKYFRVVEADPSMPPDKEQRDVHVLYRESVVQALTDTGRSSSSPSAAASTFSALYAADADATADVSKEGPKRACRATPAPAAGANPAEAAARVDNAVVVKLEKKRKRTAEDAARAQDSERKRLYALSQRWLCLPSGDREGEREWNITQA